MDVEGRREGTRLSIHSWSWGPRTDSSEVWVVWITESPERRTHRVSVSSELRRFNIECYREVGGTGYSRGGLE